MKDILAEIVEVKKDEIKLLHRNFTLSRFEDSPFWGKSFQDVKQKIKDSSERLSIIAEIKKASPSKGIIREDFDPLVFADIYSNIGVDVISVLTDKHFFQGDIQYLNSIAARFDIPLLRKDFLIDEYQVFEAKSNGADVILLIAEILSPSQICELTAAAKELNMSVLLELHSSSQFDKIDFSKNQLIGINNRDLTTFKVDVLTSARISEKLKSFNPDLVVIAESGFKSESEINNVKNSGVDGLLVGEHFMRAKNIGDSVKRFMEWCRYES